jgi:hypothetical protein
MRNLAATTALVLVLSAAVAAVMPAGGHPANANYTEHHVLYVVATNATAFTYTFNGSATGAKKAVIVDRNPAAEGWDFVRFETNASWIDAKDHAGIHSAFAVGYAEGYLTADSVFSSYINEVGPNLPAIVGSACFQQWVDRHVAYMQTTIAAGSDAVAEQMRRQLRWLQGLTAGYNAALPTLVSPYSPKPTSLNFTQIFLISFQLEIGRVLDVCNVSTAEVADTATATSKRETIPQQPDLHCSALIKVTEDDVYFAHATWFGYGMMVRQYKTYVGLGNATVTMSSYPGSLSSLDDWYMTSHGIAATETTISAWTTTRDGLVTADAASEFMRVMAANFIARDGAEWAAVFATHNSGTYNNQYMVVDMKKIDARTRPLPDGAFFVIEQMPGAVVSADMTGHLNRETYWASFNIPFFNETYVGLGYEAFYEMYGDYYSRTQYARARIFHDMHRTVTDDASLLSLMRYNNFSKDAYGVVPFCDQADGYTGETQYNCSTAGLRSACLAASARCDVSPQAYEIDVYPAMVGQVARGLWGGIDVKFTSKRRMLDGRRLQGVAVNGPSTYGDFAPFSWSAFAAAGANNSAMEAVTPHRQQPDTFDYEPLVFCEGSCA